jgi:hypothetical protein
MVSAVPMSRSRGSLSGLALVLLGAWGGLALFIGPYFHFGYLPDKAWHYSTGRLYASIVPGGVVLLMGLIVTATKSRWLGGLCALVAALAGAWFVVGRTILRVVNTSVSAYSIGHPMGTTVSRILLTDVACFSGLGVLIVFFAALSSGRISIAAHKDFEKLSEAAGAAGAGAVGGLASVGLGSAASSYDPYQPTSSIQTFLPTQEEPVVGGETRFPSQYPTVGQDAGQEQYPASSVDPFGASTNTFTPGQAGYSPGQSQYPPTQEQTNPLSGPTQEQQFPPAQR